MKLLHFKNIKDINIDTFSSCIADISVSFSSAPRFTFTPCCMETSLVAKFNALKKTAPSFHEEIYKFYLILTTFNYLSLVSNKDNTYILYSVFNNTEANRLIPMLCPHLLCHLNSCFQILSRSSNFYISQKS